jgi:hypothetical protein
MTSIELKYQSDLKEIMELINKCPHRSGITSMFVKGPPEGQGFAWCSHDGGQGQHWTDDEAAGLDMVAMLVGARGWDSSGYAFMLRGIQHAVVNNVHN